MEGILCHVVHAIWCVIQLVGAFMSNLSISAGQRLPPTPRQWASSIAGLGPHVLHGERNVTVRSVFSVRSL